MAARLLEQGSYSRTAKRRVASGHQPFLQLILTYLKESDPGPKHAANQSKDQGSNVTAGTLLHRPNDIIMVRKLLQAGLHTPAPSLEPFLLGRDLKRGASRLVLTLVSAPTSAPTGSPAAGQHQPSPPASLVCTAAPLHLLGLQVCPSSLQGSAHLPQLVPPSQSRT